ncbi:MmcQ/YjbR family DNA-binding protein [Micromonospora noduli]|uniref:MmcQ/YjbR family DNA-binding protein n=1 Tax=Micromonospora noduli TaxID=709876 RepID=A0A328N0F3_9ACTN|nr:MmcQ/YjbR family DNA-binding protein [Micromonospora noduli]RAN99252.1 hypothetical protein LAH08_03990 [Micromonospora noduli]RAO10597.1 hypothetical protein LUPAC07_05124 [Micromonospora noduli]RAO12122.1 hypothetical protein MED15_05131 [Micromonospora noduli]RAO16863.1 hypothetical protein GUI43_01102 [Micromonospora noduli]RAO36660.1 hypothetical protein ONO23_01717 [Micromonospora noduli]
MERATDERAAGVRAGALTSRSPDPLVAVDGRTGRPYGRDVVTVADVRALARTLPRSSEHLIRDRVKFRVGSMVYVAFSRDEATMGFAFPKQERAGLVATDPELFFLPGEADLRFHWMCCHAARLDHDHMTELVTEAWRMVVPKFLARQRLGS